MTAIQMLEQDIYFLTDGNRPVGNIKYSDSDFDEFKKDKFRSHIQFHAIEGHSVFPSLDLYKELYFMVGEYLMSIYK